MAVFLLEPVKEKENDQKKSPTFTEPYSADLQTIVYPSRLHFGPISVSRTFSAFLFYLRYVSHLPGLGFLFFIFIAGLAVRAFYVQYVEYEVF